MYTNPSVEIPKLSVDTSEAIVTLIQFLPEHFLGVICTDRYYMGMTISTHTEDLSIEKDSYLNLQLLHQNVLEQEHARC